jgi:long-subunit fatty acid transport protein
MMSVSAGARLVIPRRGFTLKAEYETSTKGEAEVTYNALGVTPIIGFDIRPLEGLTIGLRYEMETRLEFEYDVKTSTGGTYGGALVQALPEVLAKAGVTPDRKFNQNLPHIIAAGVEYEVIPGLALDLSGTVYLLPFADYDIGADKGADDYFDIGFDVGLGASWKLTDAIKVGAGVSYTESGTKDSYYSEQVLNASANPHLDSIAFALGGTYSLGFGLDINLGVLYCHYLPADYKAVIPGAGDVEGTNKKNVVNVGIGVSYHF